MSEEAYQQFVLTGPEGIWELHDGQLVEKPGVTWEHGDIAAELGYLLRHQLDRNAYRVRISEGRVRRPPGNIYIPDVLAASRSGAALAFWRSSPARSRSSSRSGHNPPAITTSMPKSLSTSGGAIWKSGVFTPMSGC
jgi:hypothetical protein